MEIQEIRKEMMRLWKETFHDTDQYVSLVFDNYFDPRFIEFSEKDNHIVSALLGVPYKFGYKDSSINALYLCGLATDLYYRRQGIMESLIEKINDKVKDTFDLTFLIPASEGLERYYSDRGYENAMYRIAERYTSVHDFKNTYLSYLKIQDKRVEKLKRIYFESLDVCNYSCNLKLAENIDIIRFISNMEAMSPFPVLRHSPKDIRLIIEENQNSDGTIFICSDCEDKITGIAFSNIDDSEIMIPKIYYSDNCSFYRLLEEIKHSYPEKSMVLFRYPDEEDRNAIWSRMYIAQSPLSPLGSSFESIERVYVAADHAVRYGMARIINLSEILKFTCKYINDAKFSILVNDSKEEWIACKAVDGSFSSSIINKSEYVDFKEHNPDYKELSLTDLEKLLFRKKHTGNLVNEAFQIPRLPMNMSLLLD